MSATTVRRSTVQAAEREPSLVEVTDEQLADMTRRIVEAVHPYKVILFGSRAWGDARKDSDVDLFVVVDPNGTARERYSEVSAAAHLPLIPMDLLVRTPAEVETRLAMGDFFIRDILENGRILYESERDWGKIEVHPTMTLLEEWIEKAEEDYLVVSSLSRRRKKPIPGAICFHSQQYAEKYLKAFLIRQGAVPARTHKTDDLLIDCAKYDASLTSLAFEAHVLNDYGVDPRYPGIAATDQQGGEALKAARTIRRKVRKALGL